MSRISKIFEIANNRLQKELEDERRAVDMVCVKKLSPETARALGYAVAGAFREGKCKRISLDSIE